MTTFEKIRNAALARLDAGEPPEIILQDYADFEDELRPILEAETGKRIPPLAGITSSNSKTKHQQNDSNVWLVIAGAGALILMLAVGAFAIMPFASATVIEEPPLVQVTNDVTATPVPLPGSPTPTVTTDVNAQIAAQNQTTCVGIPEQQITSAYALNTDLQQQNVSLDSDESSAETFGMGGGSVAVESASMDAVTTSDESVDDVARSAEGADVAELAVEVDAVDSDEDYDSEAYAEYEAEEASADMAIMTTSTAADAPAIANTAPQEPLRAGEIDDNAEWDTYQAYRTDYLEMYGTFNVVDVDTTGRQVIRVVDSDNNPVLNACVQIYNGESFITSSLTYATGMTLFFPNISETTRYIDEFRVVVSKGDVTTEATLDRTSIGGVTEIELDIAQQYDSIPLDIVFLLDATGSMSDEIQQLQDNILAISDQINALPDDVDVRYGLVTYRDRGDQYVTRVHDFVDNVDDFQTSLAEVRAGGGGDYPESLNEGLDMALNAVEWRGGDALQLVFLVADAPPHVDYQDDADYSLLMGDALARGIKVHTIASSGLQPEGEFILRQIAQYTMGRFIFLTYEDGVAGTPGDDRPDLEVGEAEDEQGVGDYSVSQLDELVLRLITDEIDALTGE